MNVYIPPGRVAGYHTHSLDQISVLVADADMVGQVLGEQPTPPRRNPRGNVNYVAYSKKAITHKVVECRATPFHNVVLSLIYPEPAGSPPARAPTSPATRRFGQRARPRLAAGAGARAIGGRHHPEGARHPGRHRRRRAGRKRARRGRARHGAAAGEFYWQEPDVTRAIRNSGTSRIQLVEFELK